MTALTGRKDVISGNPDCIEIRRAGPADITAVARLEAETSPEPWSEESLAHDISGNENAYVAVLTVHETDTVKKPESASPGVCPEEGKIAGYADIWMIAGEAQLNNIAVREGYRNRHLGSLLLGHMADKALELGCSVMTLEVREGNTAAVRMYEKAGFRQVGVRKAYYIDNKENALLMDLDLKARSGA